MRIVSERTVRRRFKEAGIETSRTCTLSQADTMLATQSSIVGPAGIQTRLALQDDIRIPRDRIKQVMREIDPYGFRRRQPGAAIQVQRRTAWSVGPWSTLSVDGHDKLSALGIWIYGWRDVFSGYALKLYLGRSNRNPHIINREMLQMFIDYGDNDNARVPVSIYSDHGTETVETYSYFNTIRDTYGPEENEAPRWHHTLSTHNIVIERGWRHFLNERGREIEGILTASGQHNAFNRNIPKHQAALESTIFPLVQKQLTEYITTNNYAYVRLQKNKNLPSGGTRVEWFENPQLYDGHDCSIKVPRATVEWFLRQCKKNIVETDVDFFKSKFDDLLQENENVVDRNNCWNVWHDLINYDFE